jgi:hypothetical protein
MLTTNYLELLGFGEDGTARPELMPFPVGLNGLVFKTADAESVHRQAAAAGLPVLPVQSFSRPVTIDGATRDARFRTTRLDPGKITMGRVYFCEHQTPGLVWRPESQIHPNGAHSIARVVVATGDPHRMAVLFRDCSATMRSSIMGGDASWPPEQRRSSLPPDMVAAEFGGRRSRGRAEYMAALAIRSIAARGGATAALRQGVHAEPHRVVVSASAAFNTTIVLG